MERYDMVIGLEIHAELNTKTKVFCGCANTYGSKPNTNCCPVCVGMPGALPVVNREAVEKTILSGLSMDCQINEIAVFERKNYFYPDLSKAYQISQLVKPICMGGGIEQSGKFFRLNRIHLEEDAGKLLHDDINAITKIDYNRGGVPLIEIVTEPDFTSAAEVTEFLEEIRSRLIFAGVADCKMEQGGLRCDVNLSLKPKGCKILGNRTEIKNLNSFKMVMRAIEYEAKRQAEILDQGGRIITETRKWDDNRSKTFSMRNKEESQDYRYFPDPDIYAVRISQADMERLKNRVPVLAHVLKEKFVNEFGLPEYDADLLTRSKEIADYYLECVSFFNHPKKISNWIMVDLKLSLQLPAIHLAKIIEMVEEKIITKAVGLQLLDEVIKSGRPPQELAKELGLLTKISDEQIFEILLHVKNKNPKVVEDYKTDPSRVLRFIIGQVMKQTQGKAKSDRIELLIPKIFD